MKAKVSIVTLTISCVMVFLASYAIPKFKKQEVVQVNTTVSDCSNKMDQVRLKSYEYIQPLILTDINVENPSLKNIRLKIEQYIDQKKSNQELEDASVYFRRMNDGAWFGINPNQTYNPASLTKIVYMIAFLKDAESNPGILDKKIFFSRHYSVGMEQNIREFSLRENSTYTIRDLLILMIKYSDNDATLLLSENMNLNKYLQVFKDLNIPGPPDIGEYYISPVDYSKFFRVLFNATYIKPDLSEFGLKLLTLSTFEKGLKQGVDSSVTVAHKFGERIMGSKVQLHEFGIVFIKGDPYLIGVMTKGSSLAQLSEIIANVSKITSAEFHNLSGSL